MKIHAIDVTDLPPVKRFSSDDLSDIVVIAGPNGVGKSRLIDGLIRKFQKVNPAPPARIVIRATTQAERKDWGKEQLDTSVPADAELLSRTLKKSRNRRAWNSSVIHFESDRSIQKIDPFAFTWDVKDPWLEDIGWSNTFGGLKARFQDTIHSLFRKVQSHEREIARRAIEMQRSGTTSMPLDFADPLKAFKDAFALLLAPKQLLDPDVRSQQLTYEYEGGSHPLKSLSSGESEVVNIVFDFILRSPSDCIVFFDEPELHLHPELSYKLLQALRASGGRNQFIFCTHSPEIITASLDQTVIFLAPPSVLHDGSSKNQAIRVREDDSTNEALKLLGQSIGVVALGRRLVLIEGTASSLDKQTYGLLLRNRYPSLVLVPTGGKDLMRSFTQVVRDVLDKSIWGVDFFMLCDRDAAADSETSQLEATANGKLKFLSRYHLENYFLDGFVIVEMFQDLEPPESWLRDVAQVDAKLREIAKDSLSYATSLIVSSRVRRTAGNVDVMPKGCQNKSVDELVSLLSSKLSGELTRVQAALDCHALEQVTRDTYGRLRALLDDPSDNWKREIPGKQILNKFASLAGLDVGRFKLLYITTAERSGSHAFDDIISIFSDFSTASVA